MSGEVSLDLPDSWKQTELWKQIQSTDDRLATKVQNVLQLWLPDIEAILRSGGTSPTDFTLHDAGHAFRVAQRMVQLIPDDVLPQLNSLELALLLLAAYLHDIGMTPELAHVQNHYHYLLTGEINRTGRFAEGFSESERDEFQEWLDDHGEGIEPPLCSGRPTTEQLIQARLLTTHYCRSRHNDWSAVWITKDAEQRKVHEHLYPGWITDLVRICKTHHQDENELLHDRFDPYLVPGHGCYVHFRYIAVALRIADILEFDPERTPEILIRHRGVSEGSLIHWEKDHQVGMRVDNGKKLLIQARPMTARHHKAILLMIDQIQNELSVVRSLAGRKHFQVCPGSDSTKLPHRWDLETCEATVTPQVRPDGAALYEYIEGAFRPDTEKLLGLMSGVELYGDPMAAVRELLQNAFDAVREQIAYQRLLQPDTANPQFEDMLSRLQYVQLSLSVVEGNARLVCEDSGVGMSRSIIERYLLVNGSATRHELLDLERKCRQAGFTLGRTGQFGIGVLSYFMLANRVTIRTRRSLEAGGNEPNGWQFETEGIGSFGELRADRSITKGTIVTLDVNPGVIGNDPTAWYERLRQYLNETLTYVPCRLKLTTNLLDGIPLQKSPGWNVDTNALTERIVSVLGPRGDGRTDEEELLTSARQQRIEVARLQLEQIREEIRSAITWGEQELNGTLPNNLGRYRVLAPAFHLPGGLSLGFMRVSQENGDAIVLRFFGRWAFVPYERLNISWKGMSVRARLNEGRRRSYRHEYAPVFRFGYPVHVFIDWHDKSVGRLAVSRNELILTEAAQEALEWLRDQIASAYQRICAAHESSQYSTLNRSIAGLAPYHIENSYWLNLQEMRENRAPWRPVQYPVVPSAALRGNYRGLQWKGIHVFVVPGLGEDNVNLEHHDVPPLWHHPDTTPSIIVQGPGTTIRLNPMWLDCPRVPEPPTGVRRCPFPPAWHQICGAKLESYGGRYESVTVWNSKHPLIQSITQAAWDWCCAIFPGSSLTPTAYREDLHRDGSRCAAWLVRCLDEGKRDLWAALVEQQPVLLQQIWHRIFSVTTDDMSEIGYVDRNEWLHIVSMNEWKAFHSWHDVARRYLPDPGAEWRLNVQA